MKTVGIVAEYNPFHNGHEYQIQQVREKFGADFVVVVMSGDFVQRGAPAVLSKQVRTEMALACGADLVLELPVSVSTGSAEFFASGAISLLNQLGVVDGICFGCEDDDPELFLKVSKILAEEPLLFQEALRSHLSSGKTFPAARSAAVVEYMEKQGSFDSRIAEFLSKPNNLLGLEYCKALYKRHSSMKPVPLLRAGDSYHDSDIHEHTFSSATAIRKQITQYDMEEKKISFQNSLQTLQVPESCRKLIQREMKNHCIITESDLDLLLHYALLRTPASSLTEFEDVSAALANRITQNLNSYHGFLPFIETLKTKELTYTRISRALLHIFLELRQCRHEVPYARVLGFRKNASPLLKNIKTHAMVPMLTKVSDASLHLTTEANTIFTETIKASNLYESIRSHKSSLSFRHEYQKPIVIL